MIPGLLGDGKDLISLKRHGRRHALLPGEDSADPIRRWRTIVEWDGLARPVENAVKVHSTVEAGLASRINRLPTEEKSSDGAGRIGLVQRVTSTPGDELERMFSRFNAGEFSYEQPAAGDIEYIFKHALTQEVAYNTLMVEGRKL